MVRPMIFPRPSQVTKIAMQVVLLAWLHGSAFLPGIFQWFYRRCSILQRRDRAGF